MGSPVSCMSLHIGLNAQVLLRCRRGGGEVLARKGLPFVNEDGTLEPYDSLTKEQRAAVNRYFMGTESDFHDVLQHQFQTQQDANQHGQAPQPLPKKS